MQWRLRHLFLFLALASADLQVIGAGHGRTGTTSLKLALEQLGFGTAHHMADVFQSLGRGSSHVNDWIAVAKAEPMSKERINILRKMFPSHSEYHSILDAPGYLYYRELHALYPEAKIVLSVRDSADDWVRSVDNTIGRWVVANQPWGLWPDMGVYILFRVNPVFYKWATLIESFQFDDFLQHSTAKQFYIRWNDDVKHYFKDKPEKVLVFNVKEGWKPICAFLNVSVPNTPFPHVNDSSQLHLVRIGLNVLGFFHLFAIVLLLRWFFRRLASGALKPKEKSK